MRQSEEAQLESALSRAEGAPNQLLLVFTSLATRLGHSKASQLWWAAFGARDAADT